MKFILYIAAISILFACDCDGDMTFDATHESLIAPYHIGDTIHFSCNSDLRDTIVIIDKSDLTNNCMMRGKSVEIKHLPKNNWTGGTDHDFKAINQSIITISKDVLVPGNDQFSEYYAYIEYRNFYGGISDSTTLLKDDLFKDYNINEYYVVYNENLNNEDSLGIIRIYWTKKYGLTGYELVNGSILKIEI